MTEIPIAAEGLLSDFAHAHMIALPDFHVARRAAGLAQENRPDVLLALALCIRALREGSVCLDLSVAQHMAPMQEADDGTVEQRPDLPWPDAAQWLDALAHSPAVATDSDGVAPFRLVGALLYPERYYQEERAIEAALEHRSTLVSEPLAEELLATAMVPDAEGHSPDEAQEAAIRLASCSRTLAITGGPGTGKTSTVARIIDALSHTMPGRRPFVALAAPTGKAAGRLTSSVRQSLRTDPLLAGSLTLHALLGAAPHRAQRTYHRDAPLPYDLVVVDETSMVSLSQMSWLLEAVGDSTRLVLLGDPHQLASVEEGAVLADIASSGLVPTAELGRNWRSNADINALAAAIRIGDPVRGLEVLASSPTARLVPWEAGQPLDALPDLTETLRAAGAEVLYHALSGDGRRANTALNRHRILCAHRQGPYGVSHWGDAARRFLTQALDGYHGDLERWVGQPLIITRNSDLVSNGETAVVVRAGDGITVAVDQPGGIRHFDPALLDSAADVHAMTIHKSQGSQFDVVSVVLPPVGSPLLTRELLYTAVTRAKDEVRLYGTAEAFTKAVETPTRRAGGLRRHT